MLCGIGGLLMACYPSALVPTNYNEYGHCYATDTPKEVFGSFAVIGLVLFGPLIVILMATLFWKKG